MDSIDRRQSLPKNGKSFYFAAKLFDKTTMDRVSLLYAFCRYIDDCADEESPEVARPKLLEIQEFIQGKKNRHPMSDTINELRTLGVRPEPLLGLIDGALFDVDAGQIKTQSDLIQYCYLVAGTVGLMMCDLFKVNGEKTRFHAIALGIGMQITNICRDVLEDAQNNRSYLPQDCLQANNLNIETLTAKGQTPEALRRVVREHLELADAYYEVAYEGISALPLRVRITILIAGEVYRAIGKKIVANGCNVLKGRTYLSIPEKIWVTLKSLPRMITPSFWRYSRSSGNHLDSQLSALLKGSAHRLCK